MNNASIELDLVELLKAIHSNINQRILAASKIVAKNFFRELADGKALPFMEITSPELGDVSCKKKRNSVFSPMRTQTTLSFTFRASLTMAAP